jgi:hypothetical protein
MEDAIKYIFWLSLFLIAVAYYTGTTKVGTTLGQQLGDLIMTAQGRNTSTGQFAAYPSGG